MICVSSWRTRLLNHQTEEMRLLLVPLVNPGGMGLRTRANPDGVDLMRNALVEAADPVRFMVGGQRRRARHPWYRGAAGAPMEVESAALGAMVAIEWAARRTADLAVAVLVNTSVRPWCRFHQRLRARNYPRMVRLLLGRPPARTIEGAILELTSGRVWTPAARDALIDAWCLNREDSPVSTANALRQLIAAARYRAPPQPPPIPMLLLASAGDGLVDSKCSRRLAHAWRVPLALHPSAGHDLPLDDPSWVIDQVIAWSSAPSRQG